DDMWTGKKTQDIASLSAREIPVLLNAGQLHTDRYRELFSIKCFAGKSGRSGGPGSKPRKPYQNPIRGYGVSRIRFLRCLPDVNFDSLYGISYLLSIFVPQSVSHVDITYNSSCFYPDKGSTPGIKEHQ
ncbi:MAG: hypothetical protein LIO93_02725, partial [Bacteroidales bacterium]|nr:hypothetical protein [Bacteroidales bacterium]